MAYKHGVYGEVLASNYPSDTAIGTVPVYIGTAPVHRIAGNSGNLANFKVAEYINKPILISSYREVQEMGLYSDDWATYTLGEAIYAHFMNGDNAISPIILINMLGPVENMATESTEEVIAVKEDNGTYIGYINSPVVDIANSAISFTVDGVALENATIVYAYEGDKVKFAISGASAKLTTVTATYKKIVAMEASAEDFANALKAVDDIEIVTGLIPTLLLAPSFSTRKEIAALMKQKAVEKAAQKWQIRCYVDMDCATVKTVDEAVTAYKTNYDYESEYLKVFFPMVANGDKMFHLSTIAAVTTMRTDLENDNVPNISPSNKAVEADRAVLADGTSIFIKEYQANKLNEIGVTTVNVVRQQLRLWGAHMSNYNYANEANIKPEKMFDAQMRMSDYILNYLQYNYVDEIDNSLTPKDFDATLNSIQTWLDSLVNEGKLLYAKVRFDDSINTVETLEKGDIVFNIDVTYTVNAKSMTFRLQYTRNGIVNLLAGGEE